MTEPLFEPSEAPVLFQAPPGWRWRRRQGDYWNCWCALEGRCELRTGGRRFDIAAGSCLMLPPGCVVEADHDLRAPVANFAIHGHFRDRAGRKRQPGSPPPVFVVLHDTLRLVHLAEDCQAAWRAGGRHGQAEFAALAQALIARLYRLARAGRRANDPALDELLREIRRRPALPWTVATCSARLGLSRSQVTRRFQGAFGATPAAILARCRDDHALQLLRESSLPLAEVAAASGYVDASHLSRRLRARFGVAPGILRQREA
jgi:transcriptional regulator GlxA family with amidase domain